MGVTIGSARSSYGNEKAGDQHKGLEVSTQAWYLHSKGWVVLRAKSAEMRRYMAEAMRMACKNNDIGYSQNTRMSLYNNIKSRGFDPSKTTSPVNCDCSSLVRVCILYALNKMGLGTSYDPGNFRTVTETNMLMKTGLFEKLVDDKHCKKSAYLAEGDILNTRTSGHTVIVLSSGANCDAGNTVVTIYALGDRILRNGCTGDDVKELQSILIGLGYDCGTWGADGDFGDATEMAVVSFQKASGIDADGVAGIITIKAIETAAEKYDCTEKANSVLICGGNCYIRSEPSIEGRAMSTARSGERLTYAGETSVEGWHKVLIPTGIGWVSGKYSKLVED